ncbi:MAG: response regulator [Elusimicrobia bacterium]|nr:response regulator [Elusimicrobiota bacterium]
MNQENNSGSAGEADKYFRLIAENLTDMIALVDTTGRRLYCTPNYSFLGDPEILAGTDSFNNIHPEDKERIKSIFFNTVSTGVGQSTQYRLVLQDGSVRHIQSQGIAVRSADGVVEKVIVVSRDVTEAKDAAEKQRALELQLFQADKLNSLGKTVSGVAHELNNPLTGIMGFCQLLLRDEAIQENSRHREDINTIFREAERCQKIVRNLTTFARKHKPEKTFLGLNGLLEDSLRLQEHQLSLHNIAVARELEPALPKTMADFHQLQQVFMNLLGNAQDAMARQKGAKSLSVRTRRIGAFIRAEIADSGPGIPPDCLEHIFEPFFTTKEPGKGTGLGLSISFGIIAGHGGRIWAENLPGGGARFSVELPITEDASPGEKKAAGAETLPLKGQRVLIIDDEQCVMDVTVRILRLLNLSPDTARDPATGKAKLEAGNYDAVLCDYRLPGLSGLELFKWAKALKPELEKRWIFISGSSGGEELLKTGRPVLAKPFTFEALQEMLGAVLKK